MSSVKTPLASVGVRQVCSPYSAQLSLLFFLKYTNFMTFREKINEFDHFIRMASSVFIQHRSAAG